MYKDVLRAIENIEYLPAVGIIIFMAFFLIWLWRVMVMDKQQVTEMENLPFSDGNHETTTTSNPNATHATTTS